jgi:nitroimidazol reductase NimA-like FMN-containing flavoprotein (pyridoxamine 5'-phosphate oxidase superfamily)
VRRKDKEITERHLLEDVLRRGEVCRLALFDEEYPYIVPLNFGYENGKLFLHGATSGKKLDLIRRNPRVSFEVETDLEILTAEDPCNWSMRYRSVVGRGTAVILETPEEKRHGLNVVIAHYGKESFPFPDAALQTVAVVRVDIADMTGKESGFKQS